MSLPPGACSLWCSPALVLCDCVVSSLWQSSCDGDCRRLTLPITPRIGCLRTLPPGGWYGTHTHSAHSETVSPDSRFPSQGVRNFSVPVGLDSNILVDLVVVGSVAVSEKGKLERRAVWMFLKAAPMHSPLATVHAESRTPAPVPLTWTGLVLFNQSTSHAECDRDGRD